MLGEELRKRRLSKNLTQEELAFRAGISRNYVSLIELNRKSPTVDVFMRLCDAIGVLRRDWRLGSDGHGEC